MILCVCVCVRERERETACPRLMKRKMSILLTRKTQVLKLCLHRTTSTVRITGSSLFLRGEYISSTLKKDFWELIELLPQHVPTGVWEQHWDGGGWHIYEAFSFFLFFSCWNLHLWGFPGGSVVKNLPAGVGSTRIFSWIPESGRSPGEWNGNPL